MNNYDIYIVRQNSRVYCFYYDEKYAGAVRFRVYENGKWSESRDVFLSCGRNFTVNVAKKIMVFCEDRAGNVALCYVYNDIVTSRIIFKSPYDGIIFNAILFGETMRLIYGNISSRTFSNHIWGDAVELDAAEQSPYILQETGANHALVFYQKNTEVISYGYREITTTQHGKFNPYYQNSIPIYTQSILTTQTAIHIAYVLKGVFSSKLVYKKKETTEFSAPSLLFEAPSIENISVYFAEDVLYIGFISNNALFTIESRDRGDTFCAPELYPNKFCQNTSNVTKAAYLSDTELSESKFFARELYVDKTRPWDIQILPDLREDFF
ncbi:hypothetical protein AGMMS49975_04960 [Clostridia bacterium]|nr:hypothetical protein AGMMS49975_04960 [Clostridia bacterium]